MTLTFELDLDMVFVPNICVKGHSAKLTFKVIVRTHRHADTHTRRSDCSTWTTKVDGKCRGLPTGVLERQKRFQKSTIERKLIFIQC